MSSNGAFPPALRGLHHPVPQDAEGWAAHMGTCIFRLAHVVGHVDLSASNSWSEDRWPADSRALSS